MNSIENFYKICRICGIFNEENKNIFKNSVKNNFVKKVESVFSILVSAQVDLQNEFSVFFFF